MNAPEILAELRHKAVSIDRLAAPAGPGLYAYFLAPGAALGPVTHSGEEAVYIGRSSNLAQREFDTHFAAGKTGFSTLRRSIGALLKGDLALEARPRGTGASTTNYTNYRFDDAGERRLSEWMRQRLLVGVHPHPSPEVVERELIAVAWPLLNLTGWDNPERASIKALRKTCADEARSEQRK